jgi:hypothetical protein
VDYRIRREGEELHAEVRCWETGVHQAKRSGNAEALEAMADRGVAAALEYAELLESPAERGAVLISIWFRPRCRELLLRATGRSRSLFCKQTTHRGYETGTSALARAGTHGHKEIASIGRFAGRTWSSMPACGRQFLR